MQAVCVKGQGRAVVDVVAEAQRGVVWVKAVARSGHALAAPLINKYTHTHWWRLGTVTEKGHWMSR